jgi:predicted metal-dependent peptidase
MSTVIRKSVSGALVEEEHVSVERKKECLQTAVYDVIKRSPFMGSVLQCLDIYYTHIVPRAGIMFDTQGKKWNMAINPKWFCDMLTYGNREAVLLHEIYHVTHKHPMRAPFLKLNEGRRMLMNIAMDMAINQYIKDLPKGCQECPPIEDQYKGVRCKNKACPGSCIFVEDYYDFDKTGSKIPWPKEKGMEFYYNKLIERLDEQDPEDGNGTGESEGNNPSEFDSHHWDGNAEEGEMMDATEELVKRAMQKRGLSMDKLPGHIQELLQDITARRSELNYRQLILQAIKKHASGFNREHSWTRPSRRFKNKAPGTRNGKLPSLDTYIDTSGSISVQEANDFLDIIDEFLKVGSRKCQLGLWHTNLYYHEQYKLGDRAQNAEWNKKFESGGTDVTEAMRRIYEGQPDLAIILTDGCIGDVDFESWMKPNELFPQVLWIISREGMEKHPLVRLGETIKIPASDHLGKDKRLEQQ